MENPIFYLHRLMLKECKNTRVKQGAGA